MSSLNDLDRAYLIEKVFANFTKSIATQRNDPNKDNDINYHFDMEYEPEEDYDSEYGYDGYDAEYISETEEEECFASTNEIKPKRSEKITVEGRTFNSYDDFMKFMFTQQFDEELYEEHDSQEKKREEQTFVQVTRRPKPVVKLKGNMTRVSIMQ